MKPSQALNNCNVSPVGPVVQVGGGGVGVEPGEDEEDGQKVDSDEEKEASPAFPHLGLSLPAAGAVWCISHDGRRVSTPAGGSGA